jgi:hypothetical protein
VGPAKLVVFSEYLRGPADCRHSGRGVKRSPGAHGAVIPTMANDSSINGTRRSISADTR